MRPTARSVIVGLIVLGCVAQIKWNSKPLLVWNVTASAPIGLYRRSYAPVGQATWVLINPPRPLADFAARRRYLPANVPMVKRIAAVAGDTVCRASRTITINGRVQAIALTQDSKGRALPVWRGCHRLKTGQIFVLAPSLASFDSRYFSVIPRAQIIERIEPLWTL